jgi:pSer/pThr/pTyr-binding forkhead associated (FHA) protein
MPYLQLNDKQVQLRVGETRIGAGPEVDFRLPGPLNAATASVLAIADVGRDTHVAIRRAAPDAVVRVNGVLLGAEPTPLIHGDKIEISGAELYFGDDKRGGSTQFIPSTNVPDFDRLRGPAPTRATAATGGRVISLVDGREYMVTHAGLVFGRDAGCDVVIPSSDVSRRHAEIVAGDTGYVVTDTSTNGLFVNANRVEGMQILGRGDVLRIGPEEFRFYADVVAPAVAATAASRPALVAPVMPSRIAVSPPAPVVVAPSAAPQPAIGPTPAAASFAAPVLPPMAAPPMPEPPAAATPIAAAPIAAAGPSVAAPLAPLAPLAPVPDPSVGAATPPVAGVSVPAQAAAGSALPAVSPSAAPPVEVPAEVPQPPISAPRLSLSAASVSRTPVATLEVIGGGLLRGQRYAVTTVLAHLGRGEHNDIVIAEESVSDSHAKLQRRDGVWYVTDLRSTNGTYVGGRRIDAEERLEQTADLRLGGVKLAFAVTVLEAPTEPHGATREFAGLHPVDAPRAPTRASGAAADDDERADPSIRHSQTAAPVARRGSRWLWLVLGIVVAGAALFYLLQGR